MKSSHVLRKSQNQVHATFMPDAAQAVNRFPLDLSRSTNSLRFWRHLYLFDTSSVVRLRSPPWSYLTSSCEAFSLTLTTLALYQRSLRWFGTYSWKSIPRDLPSSLVQHRTLEYKTLWCVRGTLLARHVNFFNFTSSCVTNYFSPIFLFNSQQF